MHATSLKPSIPRFWFYKPSAGSQARKKNITATRQLCHALNHHHHHHLHMPTHVYSSSHPRLWQASLAAFRLAQRLQANHPDGSMRMAEGNMHRCRQIAAQQSSRPFPVLSVCPFLASCLVPHTAHLLHKPTSFQASCSLMHVCIYACVCSNPTKKKSPCQFLDVYNQAPAAIANNYMTQMFRLCA
jgi:hypothetical protein